MKKLPLFTLLIYALLILNVFVLGFYLGSLNTNFKRTDNLMEIINDYRVGNNLEYLETDPYLCKIAKERSQEIITDWSHNGFRKLEHPPQYTVRGENLAKHFKEDLGVLAAWINSPTHKNILDGNYNVGCIGRISVAGVNYFVLEVGRIDK